MDGLGNSEGEGDLIIENVQREGGLVVHHNFPEGFLSKKISVVNLSCVSIDSHRSLGFVKGV